MKIKKMLLKFLKLKRIKEIEAMIGVEFPEDYKNFLLENNGVILNDIFWFKVKELADYITLNAIFGIDSNNNADLLKNNKLIEGDKLPYSVLIADTIEHGYIVLICRGEKKGVYYWDNSYTYDISAEDCNMYKIANDFSEFWKILEYHNEEPNYPYKYKVKFCPVCNQGWVEIVKDYSTGEPLLYCDECYAVWNNPEQIEYNNCIGNAIEILTVEPREIDIKRWGWEKYISKE